jgi:hypothetical protein
MGRHDKRFTRREWLATLLAALACSVLLYGQTQSAARPLRLLFIGNSYTYFNNLPEMFAKLAEAGHQQVETRMTAPGGWKLQDHWNKGEALKVLHEGRWDYVVLQEQSTLGLNVVIDGQPRVTSDEVFRPYADKWAAEIRKAGAQPVFYLTWARKATPDDQSVLNDAYVRAAKANRATIAPVGIAWNQVRQQHRSIELFYMDGSHPSPSGTYLAACTFYATVFHASPVGLPARIVGRPVNLDTAQVEVDKTTVLVDLPAPDAQALQAAAWAAWQSIR